MAQHPSVAHTCRSHHRPCVGVDARWQALVLDGNKIGDAGYAALAEALGGGALPKLRTLELSMNPASQAARQAVEDAIKTRA